MCKNHALCTLYVYDERRKVYGVRYTTTSNFNILLRTSTETIHDKASCPNYFCSYPSILTVCLNFRLAMLHISVADIPAYLRESEVYKLLRTMVPSRFRRTVLSCRPKC